MDNFRHLTTKMKWTVSLKKKLLKLAQEEIENLNSLVSIKEIIVKIFIKKTPAPNGLCC